MTDLPPKTGPGKMLEYRLRKGGQMLRKVCAPVRIINEWSFSSKYIASNNETVIGLLQLHQLLLPALLDPRQQNQPIIPVLESHGT